MLRVAIVGLVLMCSSLARADAVGPPPTDCPEGARGAVCHGAEYCAVAGCIGSRDCGAGARCVARELCVGPRTCFSRGGETTVTEVRAAGCDGCGGRCESQFVCVGEVFDEDVPSLDGGALDAGDDGVRHSRYCGCAIPTRRGAPVGGMVLAAALGLAIGARRRT